MHAALLIAWLDNDEVDVAAYRQQFNRMAKTLKATLPKDATPLQQSNALDKFFFKEQGFHGSRIDYYSRSNSYLNEVIDDREGLPISLSVVYMELGRRVGLKVDGVGLPGHFVVRVPTDKEGQGRLIDVFDGGRTMPAKEAEQRITESFQQPPTPDQRKQVIAEFLKASKRKAILIRMLGNLSGSARQRSDEPAVRRYADVILTVDPKNWTQRGMRIQLSLRSGLYDAALADIDWLLENQTDVIDVDQLQALRRQVEQARASQR